MPQMNALICHSAGHLALGSKERPAQSDGKLRVKIGHIGICGTDYHIYGGNIAVLGVHTDGGMCEEISVPEGNLYPAGDLSEKAAAMVEFLAIGAHGVRRSRLRPGSDVLVVGAGPIGIGAALFAAIEGANVTLRDSAQERLDLAKTVLPHAAFEVLGHEKQRSYETVFDATGNIGAMNAGLAWLAHGGTYVLLSIVKDDLRFADPEFHKRETTLVASRNALVDDFEHVMSQMRAGTVPIDALATHETTLAEAVEDLPKWASDRNTWGCYAGKAVRRACKPRGLSCPHSRASRRAHHRRRSALHFCQTHFVDGHGLGQNPEHRGGRGRGDPIEYWRQWLCATTRRSGYGFQPRHELSRQVVSSVLIRWWIASSPNRLNPQAPSQNLMRSGRLNGQMGWPRPAFIHRCIWSTLLKRLHGSNCIS